MRTLALAVLGLGISVLAIGCADPGYNGGFSNAKFPEERITGEQQARIARNMYNENREMTDDINSMLLLDPGGHMSKWNVR
jgi:hypothetical protein